MAKNLVIVESPTKAKTIKNFLSKDFLIKSSFGHIRDLPKKKLGVDIENNFIPFYEIPADKTRLVKELKKFAKESDIVWLASDEDREGEAISWHLAETLKLKESKTKRIVFHEITKTAILDAINNPRKIDKKLVDAQQARRVLDRLVGFELSPVLWKKIKPSLSAGRVQSVAVRLIVEREKEINSFKATSSYKISAIFKKDSLAKQTNNNEIKAELLQRFNTKDQASEFLKKCISANFFIKNIEKKLTKKSPAPPFITSTLQQEASRKLGFSVSKTMLIAQQLYESGKITYMRTDSVNLSNLALSMAKKEITKSYGAKYVNIRKYLTKIKGAQEAHEAIRPTYINNHYAGKDDNQKKLYALIWKRTIASQMSQALLEKTNVTIEASSVKENFLAKGEILKFDGFLKVYIESDNTGNDIQNKMLPPVTIGDKLISKEINAIEKFTQHQPRYTEATLVKKMEELGIGRPSTYAPTISTIQKRGYVVNETREGITRSYNYITLINDKIKEEIKTENTGYEKSKLFPTDIGIVVNSFLVEHFKNILDYNFTASIEKEFDEIEQGKKIWNKTISEFYKPFHKQIEDTLKIPEKISGEKLLGKDPETGEKIIARIGRFGPLVQIGENKDDKKPKFASLRKGQSIETITTEEALNLFKLPRTVGKYEENEIIAAIGRFGPYVKHKSNFYSLTKNDDPMTISEQRAIEIIEEKKEKNRKKIIKEFEENENVKILNGKWGAYISFKRKNYKIPKDKDPKTLTLSECLKITKETPNNKKSVPHNFNKKKK